MPLRRFEMEKPNGKRRTLGIFTVEDRIVQRAALNALEPLWEPSFASLECNFGFRPNRSVELAVKRVLDYRVAGDLFVVDADIQDCFASLDHSLVMDRVSQRVRDKRMLKLVQMWLDTGQVLPRAGSDAASNAPLFDRVTDYAMGAVDEAVSEMLYRQGHAGADYGAYPGGADDYDLHASRDMAGDPAADARRAARKELFKRLGKDAVFLGLTFLGRKRRLLSPAMLGAAGAAVLGAAVYPAASRAIRERLGGPSGGVGAVQGSALSPLLANIVLHEFDAVMIRAGFHLTRFADDWVVTSRDQPRAEQALETATRKLAELRLRINPDKTRIIRFEQGLEFLGYRFDQFQPTATPAPTSTQQPISVLWREVPAAAAEARRKLAPVVARASEAARHAAGKVTDLFRRGGKE